jgi:hypothetical protein
MQSTSPHPTSLRSILILSTHLQLGLPSGLFPSGFHCRRILEDDGKQNLRWLENSDCLLFLMSTVYNITDLYSVIWMLTGNIETWK